MAIYHCNIDIISRSEGQSVIAAAAYRSGTAILDEQLQQTTDYSKKHWQVKHSEVNLPSHAPKEYADRAILWNSVEKAEKNKNSQLAREAEIALAREWSLDEQIDIVREYVQQNFVSKGMCADWSIHDKGDGNPHCHILLTMREIDQNGNWKSKRTSSYKLDENGNKIPVIDPETGQQKIGANNRKMWQREYSERSPWDDKELFLDWRKQWAITANKYLDKDHQISSESYATLGIDKEPTIHEGWYARKMESKGEVSYRMEHNRAVKERNSIREQIRVLGQELYTSLKAKLDSYVDYFQSGIKRLQEALKEAHTSTFEENRYVGTHLDKTRATGLFSELVEGIDHFPEERQPDYGYKYTREAPKQAHSSTFEKDEALTTQELLNALDDDYEWNRLMEKKYGKRWNYGKRTPQKQKYAEEQNYAEEQDKGRER